jgi:hypothetical protein
LRWLGFWLCPRQVSWRARSFVIISVLGIDGCSRYTVNIYSILPDVTGKFHFKLWFKEAF